MPNIHLLQVNIEKSRHLTRIIPLLEKESPDVVCLQEVCEYDIPLLSQALGNSVTHVFTPQFRTTKDGVVLLEGSAVLSKLPVQNTFVKYYTDETNMLQERDFATAALKHSTESYAVTACDIEKDGVLFRIGTTHFTWTPDGEADDFQRTDMRNMLAVLQPMGDLVLTGDFNAPRGGEIFAILAKEFTDNVPPHYTSSIDGTLHRAGALPYMVDGIFSTQGYLVTDVEMICGVSDHCALRATVARK